METHLSKKPSLYYAGFWKRVAALFVDLLLFFAIGVALALAGFDIGFRDPSEQKFFDLLFGWIYAATMESSSRQGTFGKMALGIKVTDLQGNKIGFAQATGRYFGRLLSAVIFLIGFLMVAWTEKKQGLHDMMASCLVVNKT